MNPGEYYANIVQSLAHNADESRPIMLGKLAEEYIADKGLHSDEATVLLLAESLKHDTLLAEAALEKYDKHTRPGFILPIAGVVAFIAVALINFFPNENTTFWLLILIGGMLYFCLRMLPGYRKRLPAFRDAIKRLAENAIDAANNNPRSDWSESIINRLNIKAMLRAANFRSPFPDWSDELLGLVTTVEE